MGEEISLKKDWERTIVGLVKVEVGKGIRHGGGVFGQGKDQLLELECTMSFVLRPS